MRRRTGYHLTFWFCIFLIISFASLAASATVLFSLTLALSLVILMTIPVYLHFYFLDHFFNAKRYTLYVSLVIATIVVLSPLFYLYFSNFFGTKNNIVQWMIDIIFVLVTTTAIKFVKHGFRQRLQLHEIKAKQLQTELSLLKSQVNPHFLFNTLNNLFSMALEHGDRTVAEGISRLSHLMRYMIHESGEEKVSLKKEVEQLERFIALQKMRFSDEDAIHIEFQVEGDMDGIQIPPMILIPFVENAFKHGISLCDASSIDMRLGINSKRLIFSVENTVHHAVRGILESTSGIGLENVKRRLELLYPKNHELTVRQADDTFSVRLVLHY
ncbi:MAG: histidine kinase [Gemmatimonadota bacterium]|nr:MAG: histidine kinase [Gemmatimonadota bacterium]